MSINVDFDYFHTADWDFGIPGLTLESRSGSRDWILTGICDPYRKSKQQKLIDSLGRNIDLWIYIQRSMFRNLSSQRADPRVSNNRSPPFEYATYKRDLLC